MAVPNFSLSRLMQSGLRCSTPPRSAAPPASFRTFFGTFGRSPAGSPPPEFSDDMLGIKWKTTADGYHLRLSLGPVSDDQVNVKIKGSQLIAEGKKEDRIPGSCIASILRFKVDLPMDAIEPDEFTAKMDGWFLNVFFPRKKVGGEAKKGSYDA